ncbi:hypothetical protein ACOMHN_025140 [Nucella lapillus]
MSSLTSEEVAFIVIISIILVVSVVCNILVVVVVGVNPPLRTPTHLLICNLSVSDLILASLVLPQNLHDLTHIEENYYEGDLLCRLVYACPLLCIMVSIYTMVAISFERTHAILHLSSKPNKLTFRAAAVQLAVIWVMSAILSLPTAYEHSQYVVHPAHEDSENGTSIPEVLGCGSNGVSYAYRVINGVGLVFIAYVVPLVILLYNYGQILQFFRRKGVFGKQAAQRGAAFQVLFKTRMTVVKMLILVAVIFAVSWAPYFALLLWEKITGISDTAHLDGPSNMLKIFFSAFSTAYNFSLYVSYNRNFRKGVLTLLGYLAHAPRFCTSTSRVAPSNETKFVPPQQTIKPACSTLA